MNTAFLFYATFINLLYLSQAFPQYPNDRFFFDPDFDFHDFVLPSKTTAKVPVRAGKPRAPIIANIQQQNVVTPVPILKQINRHNENGSYTYGFESADGSFKIETKLATGEVIGKYGYVDDRGKLRVVEYGASKYGFQPAGEGITIPPITIGGTSYNETDDLPSPPLPPPHSKSAEVIRILSKPPNPKRKSQQKPIPLPAPVPQYSVLEPEESAGRPILTPADINALQFIFNEQQQHQHQQQQQHQHQQLYQAQRKPSSSSSLTPFQQQQQRFEEHLARENDRPPFVASFPVFDVIPLPSSDLPRSRAHHVPFDVPSRTQSSATKSATAASVKNRAAKPKLVLVTPSGAAIEEVPPNPVRRSSNGVRASFHEGRSILDELMKQYAIPSRSPAISDYSFSYNNY